MNRFISPIDRGFKFLSLRKYFYLSILFAIHLVLLNCFLPMHRIYSEGVSTFSSLKLIEFGWNVEESFALGSKYYAEAFTVSDESFDSIVDDANNSRSAKPINLRNEISKLLIKKNTVVLFMLYNLKPDYKLNFTELDSSLVKTSNQVYLMIIII